MRCYRDLGRYLGASLLVSWIAGCAVAPPQPAPTPKTAPPATSVPPSLPPPPVAPAPKTYSGAYPDRLEAATRDAVAGSSVRVLRNANTVKLIIPANALFAANSAQLQPRFLPVLDNLVTVCRDFNKVAINVKGFTDSTGSFEHNQQLSEQRARNVGAYLSRGAAAGRIQMTGYGPRYPIADNKTDAGRSQNRRIEIELVAS